MAYSSLENILSPAQPNHRKEIEEILKDHTMNGREYSHRLFVCDECYRLVSRLHVKLIYGTNQVYETVSYCRKCGSRMRLLSGLDPIQLSDSRSTLHHYA
jgi:hypothetical protein